MSSIFVTVLICLSSTYAYVGYAIHVHRDITIFEQIHSCCIQALSAL